MQAPSSKTTTALESSDRIDPRQPLVPVGAENTGDDADDKGKSEGWSTGAKVGVGAGAVVGSGLLAYGAFRLGLALGWWGGSTNQIIIDGEDGGGSKGEGKPSEGSGSGGVASGNPPNMSGNPEGYNTKLFPSPLAVRIAMKALGYSVEIEGEPLVGFAETHGEVQHFQEDWNTVIKAIDRGKVKLSKNVPEYKYLAMYRGLLTVDDVPGKYTLRAVEIAARNKLINSVSFSALRKAAI
ncbi:MAG: hypothetical protein KC457_27860 [Myxococcales bacterium]|nr:hypothetical protein [Myxococcales bacterium]